MNRCGHAGGLLGFWIASARESVFEGKSADQPDLKSYHFCRMISSGPDSEEVSQGRLGTQGRGRANENASKQPLPFISLNRCILILILKVFFAIVNQIVCVGCNESVVVHILLSLCSIPSRVRGRMK